jgi:hypothetical protein
VSVFDRIAPFEKGFVTVDSSTLGLAKGTLVDLDAVIAQLPREQLALRTVAVLTGLFADLENGLRNVSDSMARAIGGEPGEAISRALRQDPRSIFVEPMQQLIMLRRCLTLAGNGPDVWSDEGLRLYFDACRFAADVASVEKDKKAEGPPDLAENALVIASSFLLRMALLNPPDLLLWVGRMRLMLHDLPNEEERARVWAQRLEARIMAVFGLTFNEVAQFVGILVLWSRRFKDIGEVFKPGAGIALNLDNWISQTHLTKEQLLKFFGRTARPIGETLSDTSLGGPLSILPFRDRPFIQFPDGAYAPVYPPLVAEKLTYDLFWWAGTPEKNQDRPWQRDWGDLVELYVVRLLAWIAEKTGCGFKADIKWGGGQVDAAMWSKGHVVLFEISASMMKDAEAHSGDPEALQEGLYRTLVRSKSDSKDKIEAVAQVARDAKALLAGELKEQLEVGEVIRVYPVVIAIDRRVRVQTLRFWFDKMFNAEVAGMLSRWRVGPVAVLTLEDLETIEQMVREDHGALKGEPPGLIRLVRQWDMVRDDLPKQNIRATAWHQFIREFDPPGRNDRLQAEAAKWWAEVKEVFKGHDAPSANGDDAA